MGCPEMLDLQSYLHAISAQESCGAGFTQQINGGRAAWSLGAQRCPGGLGFGLAWGLLPLSLFLFHLLEWECLFYDCPSIVFWKYNNITC